MVCLQTLWSISSASSRWMLGAATALLLLITACTADLASGEVVLERVESEEHPFQVRRVIGGLEHPWAIEFLPDGRVLVTERPGRLQVFKDGELTQVEGVPEVWARGQGGLLDVISHPQFEENGWIYLSFAAAYDGGAGTKVVRAVLDGNRLRDVKEIFRMHPAGRGGNHFGSRFAFDDEGYLYISLGERNDRHRAQQLDSHHGSLLRLHDDGRVPEGNPFVGREGALQEIYTYGHRNAQGLLYDPATDRLWLHEHGPRGGDALRIIEPGKNYGWPIATYGQEYRGGAIGITPDRLDEVADPLLHWTPSIAPSGLALYRGDAFPGWEGNLFVGALAQRHIRRVVIEGDQVVHQEELLRNKLGRIREVVMGTDGYLWFATDEQNGGVYRIEPVE